jgi:EamA domain-containing membrane protein RarD
MALPAPKNDPVGPASALYSLLRKTAALHSLEGLFYDIAILSLPAALVLGTLAAREDSGFTATEQPVPGR